MFELYGMIKLIDVDWEINLAEKKEPEETGYIIATNLLPMSNGKILIQVNLLYSKMEK